MRYTYGDESDDNLDGFGNEYPERPHRPDWERSGFQEQAPPLGRWTIEWCRNGFLREEIVGYAIEAAEDQVRKWKLGGDEGFAVLNRNLAYERLGDILNWLYEEPK